MLAAFNAADSPLAAGIGAVLGVAVAIVIGWGIYRGGVKINLAKFFMLTGFVLVLVAAGLLASAAHTAHEAGWLNSFQHQVLDLTWLVDPGSVRAAILTGMFGLQPQPVTAEVVVWLAYAIPMSIVVFWPARVPQRPQQAEAVPVNA
jgi:high-affinity iron transporter